MEAHQHEIKAFLLSKLDALYERAKPHLPATTEKDRETYLQGARMFLHMSTVPFLYYSKMINENTDELIGEMSVPSRKRKPGGGADGTAKKSRPEPPALQIHNGYHGSHYQKHSMQPASSHASMGIENPIPSPVYATINPPTSQTVSNDLW